MRLGIMPRSTRVWLILGVAALMLLAFRSLPARADLDGPTGYTEVRLTQSVTTYTRPDPTSPVMAVLPPFSVVDAILRQIGTDGTIWMQVTTPDRLPLGWMRLSDYLTGIPTEISL